MTSLIPGLRIGHFTDTERGTGCTVILCESGAVAGVDVRGAAPGTRETDLLDPSNMVPSVHAVVLTGGSAYGLGAADGVMRYLQERGVGFDTRIHPVPIVPAAVVFDLGLGPVAWPDAAAGYAACEAATEDTPAEGSVGAGTGATVGKIMGPTGAVKGGVGYAAVTLPAGATVAALIVVNALGDVVDPATGEIVAGARGPDGRFVDAVKILTGGWSLSEAGTNTTIGAVMTDAKLTKAEARALARTAHDGLAWAVRPAHTLFDGDTLFALSIGEKAADAVSLGTAAAVVVSQAILRAVRAADGLFGVPGIREIQSAPASGNSD
ncbi:MAG: P1 family peptidase [Anaerolineae bacterium]